MKNVLSGCKNHVNYALREVENAYNTFQEALENAKAEGYKQGFEDAIVSQGNYIETQGGESALFRETMDELSRKYERAKVNWFNKIATFTKRHEDYVYAVEHEWWRRDHDEHEYEHDYYWRKDRCYKKPTDKDVIICAEAMRSLGEAETWLTKDAKIEPWVEKMGCTYATDPEEFKKKVYEYIGVMEK